MLLQVYLGCNFASLADPWTILATVPLRLTIHHISGNQPKLPFTTPAGVACCAWTLRNAPPLWRLPAHSVFATEGQQ